MNEGQVVINVALGWGWLGAGKGTFAAAVGAWGGHLGEGKGTTSCGAWHRHRVAERTVLHWGIGTAEVEL